MRIVCLSAEAADLCARIGAWDEVVAVTAFAPQDNLPPKPVIGGFSTLDCERVANLAPDLVIAFSDVQAEFSAQLIRAGCTVLTTNQRTLAEIAATIRLIGGAVGHAREAAAVATDFEEALARLATDAGPWPRVYFEEWPDPMISGIGWVGELIERAGGMDVFAERRGKSSRERVVTPLEVIAADPQIILASWCGKDVRLESIRRRPGFVRLNAIQNQQLFALPSDLLLQPGPRLLAGAREIRRLLDAWRERQGRAD